MILKGIVAELCYKSFSCHAEPISPVFITVYSFNACVVIFGHLDDRLRSPWRFYSCSFLSHVCPCILVLGQSFGFGLIFPYLSTVSIFCQILSSFKPTLMLQYLQFAFCVRLASFGYSITSLITLKYIFTFDSLFKYLFSHIIYFSAPDINVVLRTYLLDLTLYCLFFKNP